MTLALLIVILPLLGAVFVGLVGRIDASLPRWIALVVPVGQIALMLSGVADDASFGATWFARDGLSDAFVWLSVFVCALAILASWEVSERAAAHHSLILMLQSAVTGVFLATDLVAFFVCWELVLIPMFLLISGWGSSDRRRAALKYAVYNFFGGVVLLAGLLVVIAGSGDTSMADALSQQGIAAGPVGFWLIVVGLLVKLPGVPLHTWLPDAHTEAPTAGSMILAGVLLKMGGYGLIRIAVPLAAATGVDASSVLGAVGIVGVVWGGLTALVQNDVKRIVAYSSIAHMGFVSIAVASGDEASLTAAVLTMVSHGVVAPLLFFLVGSAYQRTHSRDIAAYGGLGAIAPRWSTLFVFGCLASAGLPALSGFPGEYVTLLHAWPRFGWWLLIAGAGVFLAGAYNVRAIRSMVQGGPGALSEKVTDLTPRELFVGFACIAVIVAVGVAPWLVADSVSPTLASVISTGSEVTR